MLNGGYIMVSKTDTDLYKKLNNALTLGKPILFYENDTTCYYIDTIALSGTDIVLTKGGKTITVEEDGDITESGNIQPNEKHLFRHLIFIEKAWSSGPLSAGINIIIDLLLNTDEQLSVSDLLGYIKDGSKYDGYNATGNYRLDNDYDIVLGVYSDNNDLYVIHNTISLSNPVFSSDLVSGFTSSDIKNYKVVQIF